MTKSIKLKFILIIILAVALRLFLAATTYHPDLRTFQYAGEVVGNGHILDLYDYLQKLPDSMEIKRLIVFNYPPAIYLFDGLSNFILTTIFGKELLNGFLISTENYIGNPVFNLHLLLLKLPYLIFDLGILAILLKLFTSVKEKFWVMIIWLFNPVVLHATYMMGQFDIIPTFFVILALYLAKQQKLKSAAVSLGVGAAFKIFPIFLLIPLVVLEKSFKKRIILLTLGVLPYLLFIVPYLQSEGFRTTALVASQTDKSFYAQIPLSGNESIILFPFFLILYYLFIWRKSIKIQNLSGLLLIPILIFYIFTHFHPQWVLWSFPLLIVDLIKRKDPLVLLILTVTYIGMLFMFDPTLTVNIFSPLITSLYYQPDVWHNLKIDLDFIRSILQSIFAATAAYLIYTNLQERSDERN